MVDLLRMRAIWFILPLVLVSYAPSAGLRGLWVGPYFTDVFGASTAQVGTVTTLMALAMIAGTFCYGPLDRLLGYAQMGDFHRQSDRRLVVLCPLSLWRR